MLLILKPRLWNANGDIDIETATVEYDFHYRTSNGILKTSIAHACGMLILDLSHRHRQAIS